jgi:ribulose kinase
MLAAVAGGSIADLTEAAELVGGGGTTLDPDRDRTAAYDDAYAAYRRLFDALEPLSP